MLKTIIIASAATLLSVGSAWAQSTAYYGAKGQFIGRAQTYPNSPTTSFYGANGQYGGSAQTYGGSTSFYGANGTLIGSARR
jgi:hypothetical protein